jgi:hypothetical protein
MRKNHILILAICLSVFVVAFAGEKRITQTEITVDTAIKDVGKPLSQPLFSEPDTVQASSWYLISAVVIDASSPNFGAEGTGGEAIVDTGSSENYGSSSGYEEVSGVSCTAGDANGSGGVDIDDVVYLISYIFSSGPEPTPGICCGDANASGSVDIDDVVYLISYIFAGGPPPIQAC